MLEHTFIHIPGIGPRTERTLWERGVLTWEDFLNHPQPLLPGRKDAFVRHELELSREHREDPSFFVPRLSQNERWRLYDAFRERTVFLDIETSGMFQDLDEITIIGLYDGREVRTFVNGRDLEAFEEALSPFSLLVTFNGSCFDLPFIQRWFRGINLPPVHIDLRFLLKRLGLRGGLKNLEKRLGLHRDPEIQDLDGWDAVFLWRAYQWGDEEALERLIRYNTMDIIHLKPLLEWGVRELKRRLLNIPG